MAASSPGMVTLVASSVNISHKLVIFLLYNNLFIYQVLCTLIYRRRSLYSFIRSLHGSNGICRATLCFFIMRNIVRLNLKLDVTADFSTTDYYFFHFVNRTVSQSNIVLVGTGMDFIMDFATVIFINIIKTRRKFAL